MCIKNEHKPPRNITSWGLTQRFKKTPNSQQALDHSNKEHIQDSISLQSPYFKPWFLHLCWHITKSYRKKGAKNCVNIKRNRKLSFLSNRSLEQNAFSLKFTMFIPFLTKLLYGCMFPAIFSQIHQTRPLGNWRCDT